jgi:hypothetical protein
MLATSLWLISEARKFPKLDVVKVYQNNRCGSSDIDGWNDNCIVRKDDDPVQLRMDDICDHSFVSIILTRLSITDRLESSSFCMDSGNYLRKLELYQLKRSICSLGKMRLISLKRPGFNEIRRICLKRWVPDTYHSPSSSFRGSRHRRFGCGSCDRA